MSVFNKERLMKLRERLSSITIKQAVVIVLAVYLLDQLTKIAVKAYIAPTLQFIDILPFFSIVYVQNTGSAFGLFKSLGNVFFISVGIVATVVMAYLIVNDPPQRLVYSLFIGGALGNITDRVLYGYVVDFLDFYIGRHHWPAFNIADSALSVGMVLLVWLSFGKKT